MNLFAFMMTLLALFRQCDSTRCKIFPADNILNTPIDQLPIDANSDDYIHSIGFNTGLHPDFGAGLYQQKLIGIPWNMVWNKTVTSKVKFQYASESDKVPYPIPKNPRIENGSSDRHVLMLNRDSCVLYELYNARKTRKGSQAYKKGFIWKAGSGARFNLRSNALRPANWTSADAAGLPIYPLLVKRAAVASGVIRHAIRFTAATTRNTFVWPARHKASSNSSSFLPPMGQRFRLKASFDISGFSSDTKVILTAMKRYGIILADNGSNWYISGEPHDQWDNDNLVREFRLIKGSDFEAVDVSGLMVDKDSGQARIQS